MRGLVQDEKSGDGPLLRSQVLVEREHYSEVVAEPILAAPHLSKRPSSCRCVCDDGQGAHVESDRPVRVFEFEKLGVVLDAVAKARNEAVHPALKLFDRQFLAQRFDLLLELAELGLDGGGLRRFGNGVEEQPDSTTDEGALDEHIAVGADLGLGRVEIPDALVDIGDLCLEIPDPAIDFGDVSFESGTVRVQAIDTGALLEALKRGLARGSASPRTSGRDCQLWAVGTVR